jgi:hypothetical protein
VAEEPFKAHDVWTFGWPGSETIYGARCNLCDAAWSVRGNREFAQIWLAQFRQEACPSSSDRTLPRGPRPAVW